MAVLDPLDLPAQLKVNRLLHELETVEVLDLAPCPQRRTGLAHRDIGVTAEAALLHVAVTDADPGHNLVQFLGVGHCLFARSHVRLGHDLQQGRASPVQIDPGLPNKVLVQGLAGVFFEMGAHQSHRSLLVAHEEFHLAALHHRNFKLTDLVALGQVRIKIVLARKNAARRNVRPDGQTELDGALHRPLVHHRQRARQCQIDGAGLRIGLGAKGGRSPTENLGAGGELRVGLKTDHHFIAVHQR